MKITKKDLENIINETIEELMLEFEFKGLTKKQRRAREEELGYDPDYVDGRVKKYGRETYVSRLAGQPRPSGRSKKKGFDLRSVAWHQRTGGEGSHGGFLALMDMSDDQLIKIYSLLKGQNIGPTKAAAEARAILNTPKSDLAAAESGRSRLAFMIQDLRDKRKAAKSAEREKELAKIQEIINETIKELFKEENPGLPVPDGANFTATMEPIPMPTGKEVLRDLDTVWRAAILNGFDPHHRRSPMSARAGRTIQDLYGLMMMDELEAIPLVQNIVQDMTKILKQRGVTDISKYGGPVGDLLDNREWEGYPPLESPYRTIKAADFDPLAGTSPRGMARDRTRDF